MHWGISVAMAWLCHGYGMAIDAVGYGDLWGTDPLLLEM